MDPRAVTEQAKGDLAIYEHQEGRAKRWAHLTEGLENQKAENEIERQASRNRRIVTEILCDNLARALANPRQLIGEAIDPTEIPVFTSNLLGLVRRVYPDLIVQKIASVQPMPGPTARVYYLDFMYGTTRLTVSDGDSVTAKLEKNYGNIAPSQPVPEMKLKLTPLTMTAEARKLRAVWPIEAEQDLSSQYGLDMNGEMMGMLGFEIRREIDRTVVEDMLLNATAGNINWNKNGGSGSPWSSLDPKVYGQTLYQAIIDADWLVYKKRFVHPNWIVTSPDVAARLEKLENFRMFQGADQNTFNLGIVTFGTVANRWTVYVDPLFTADKLLLGYRGGSIFEAGYIYAPYIPAWTSPAFFDNTVFEWSRGMMSRFAGQMVVGDMFSTVTIQAS